MVILDSQGLSHIAKLYIVTKYIYIYNSPVPFNLVGEWDSFPFFFFFFLSASAFLLPVALLLKIGTFSKHFLSLSSSPFSLFSLLTFFWFSFPVCFQLILGCHKLSEQFPKAEIYPYPQIPLNFWSFLFMSGAECMTKPWKNHNLFQEPSHP